MTSPLSSISSPASSQTHHHAITLLLLLLIGPCAADGGDDFSNNLFSDLAPLLTLFGEQVAKQFLSQSLHWLDNVIFAMAPLGIITGMVSAIRVGGPRWLRAVIGRARESKGDAEVELMSSTSGDVCELWNGDTVVRTLGAPSIVEVVFLEKVEEGMRGEEGGEESNIRTLVDSNFAGVFSFEEAEQFGLFRKKGFDPDQMPDVIPGHGVIASDTPIFELGGVELQPIIAMQEAVPYSSREEEEDAASVDNYDVVLAETGLLREEYVPAAPNISLNAGIALGSKLELALVAIAGTALQIGVLAFAGIIMYKKDLEDDFRKDGRRMSGYAYPLTAIGTVFVTVGMYLCSMVVQNRSVEEKWVKIPSASARGYRIRTAWLQKGQVVTDQEFPSCVIMAPADGQYHLTSRPDPAFKTQHTWVVVGSVISVVGFVGQFSGLRAMHYSVTLAQLGATLIMSFLRIIVRRQLSSRPAVENVTKSRELEWMTRRISGCRRWRVLPIPVAAVSPDNENLNEKDGSNRMASHCFKVRTRLSTMAKWEDDPAISSTVQSMVTAVEGTLNYLYNSTISLKPESLATDTFVWYVYVVANSDSTAYFDTYGKVSKYERVGITMTRNTRWEDGNQVWGGWQVNRIQLEAALSLWFFELRDQDELGSGYVDAAQGNDTRSLFLLGRDTKLSRLDYETFIGRGTKLSAVPEGLGSDLPVRLHRKFGFADYSQPGESHVGVFSFSTTAELCKRHFFASFFAEAAGLISSLNGTNTVRRNPDATDSQSFRLENSNLRQLTELVHDAGLGTSEAILMCLVPPLRYNGNLLRASNAFDAVVDQLKQMGDTAAAEAMEHRLFYLCELPVNTLKREQHWDVTSDYVFSLASAFKTSFGDNDRRTARAMSMVRRFCDSFASFVRFSIETAKYKIDGMQDVEADNIYDTLVGIRMAAADLLDPTSPLVEALQQLEFDIVPIRRIDGVDSFPSQHVVVELMADVPLDISPISALGRRAGSPAASGHERFGTYEDFQLPKDYPQELWESMNQGNVRKISRKMKETSTYHNMFLAHLPSSLLLAVVTGNPGLFRYLLRWTLKNSEAISGEEWQYGRALQLAAKRGHISMVELMFELVPEPRLADVIDYAQRAPFLTPLQLSCKGGHFEIASLLLLAGADKDADPNVSMRVNDRGEAIGVGSKTPIHLAAANGHSSIVSLLLFHGANGDALDATGNSILHLAASDGNLGIVQLCIKHALSIIHSSNMAEETPLHLACRGGHVKCVEELYRARIDINARDENGSAPLHVAALHGRREIVQNLLDFGADPHARDRAGQTALHCAAIGSHIAIVEILVSRGANIEEQSYSGATPLFTAVEKGGLDAPDAAFVAMLLERFGANVDACTNLGRSPLHAAAALADGGEVSRQLLEFGADVSLKDFKGRTPLHVAATNSSTTGCLDFLLSSLRNLDIFGEPLEDENAETFFGTRRHRTCDIIDGLDSNRHSPLLVAIWQGNWAAARSLISHGANARLWTKDGKTAVHLWTLRALGSPWQGVPGDVAGMYTGEVDYEEPPEFSLTAEDKDILRLLLECGVDINQADAIGNTALHYAAESTTDTEGSVAKLLAEHGADETVAGGNSVSVLVAAATKGNAAVVRLLLQTGTAAYDSYVRSGALVLDVLRACVGSLLPETISTEQVVEVLSALVSFGATLNPPSFLPEGPERGPYVDPKNSPLYWAVRSGRPPLVKYLLDSGASAQIFYSPIYNTPLIQMLVEAADPLITSSYNSEIVGLLIDAGMSLDWVDRGDGAMSALSYAIFMGNEDVVEDLLRRGAKVTFASEDSSADQTAILGGPPSSKPSISERTNWRSDVHLAAALSSEFVLKRLIEVQPSVRLDARLADGSGWTCAHVAARYGSLNVLMFLYKRDDGPDLLAAKDAQGYNCLHHCLRFPNVLEYLLLIARMNPNEKQGPKGRTVLHSAVCMFDNQTLADGWGDDSERWRTLCGIENAVHLLVAFGADADIKDDDGKTADEVLLDDAVRYVPMYGDAFEKLNEIGGSLKKSKRWSDGEISLP